MGSLLRMLPGVGAGIFALGAVAAAAFAGGAPTIAAAPLIPVGQEQVNTVTSIDYWRVKLAQADRLTLAFAPQKNFSWVEVCVYRPDVTDDTVATRPCYASERGVSGESFTVTARPPGTWIVAV